MWQLKSFALSKRDDIGCIHEHIMQVLSEGQWWADMAGKKTAQQVSEQAQ